jgi:hypothetical protein
MKSKSYSLDENFRVTEPNLGNAELYRIEFQPLDVIILFRLAETDRPCAMTLRRARWLAFSTDHVQNLVDSVRIFPTFDQALVTLGRDRLLSFLTSEQRAPSGDLRFVHIEPVAGPHMVAATEDVGFLTLASQMVSRKVSEDRDGKADSSSLASGTSSGEEQEEGQAAQRIVPLRPSALKTTAEQEVILRAFLIPGNDRG